MGIEKASDLSTDQEKFLASELIARTMLKLVCAQACKKVQQPHGAGTTAYFVRYKRMNVPTVPLSETGDDPTSSSFANDGVNVALDQWGDIIEVTDIAILATMHPVLEQMTELLSDNAQRVIDREIQLVWLAGTNVQYGDATVTARASITSAMTITDTLVTRARVSLSNGTGAGGAAPFDGPDSNSANDAKEYGQIKSVRMGRHYLAICGPGIMGDIQKASTSLGVFASVAMYANQEALYNSEVGIWLGFRWVESNFLPSFTALGNSTAAITMSTNAAGITGMTGATSTSLGTLSDGTYYCKITRKDLLRGFEEAITIEHTITLAGGGSTESFTFLTPSTAGYVYNFYLGSSTGDANMFLAASNVAAAVTTRFTAIPGSGANPPQSVHLTLTADPTSVQVVFLIGAGWTGWVSLQNLQFYISQDISIPGRVLRLKRQAGYKFMSKAIILDQNKGLRLELACSTM